MSKAHTVKLGREAVVLQWCPDHYYIPRMTGTPSNRYRIGGIIGILKVGPVVVHFELGARRRRLEVHRDRPQGPTHHCGWTRGTGFRKTDYLPGGRFHRDV